MRKKFLFIALLLVGIAVVYLYLKEVSFSPLKEKEFQMLFPNYTGSSKKVCSVDFIGLSSHDELFEFYSYKTGKVSIDTTYPKFVNEWEREELTTATLISKWKSCPIDTVAMKLYEFTLTANNLDEKECLSSFNKELSNPNNYYAYVYFNELEDYFLLYCSESEYLYYIRRKGF
jgi:hypothetical protein